LTKKKWGKKLFSWFSVTSVSIHPTPVSDGNISIENMMIIKKGLNQIINKRQNNPT
jgi:hypothetical protein